MSERVIGNCPLCEEHSLHFFGEGEHQTQQCIACGYVTSGKYKGSIKDNEEFKKLGEEMKNWAKEENGSIWIPTMMTLPTGMLYPFNNEEGNMKWGYAKMIDIPEEEQLNYPIPNQPNLFYKKTYDVDNAKTYDTFFEAMIEVNEESKKQSSQPPKIKLPKLKKIDGK